VADAGADGLGERVDVLILDFFEDVGRKKTGGQAGVLRLLGDEKRGRLDRKVVELLRGGAVVQAADGLRAIFSTSIFSRPWPERATARTILLTSTTRGAVALADLHRGRVRVLVVVRSRE